MNETVQPQILTPAYPPLKIEGLNSWSSLFLEVLPSAQQVNVVTGYASEESLKLISNLIADQKAKPDSKLKSFNFCLGMAYFDGLTKRQKVALAELDKVLKEKQLGRVHVPMSIQVHSKVTRMETTDSSYFIIGSTNFTGVIPHRQSELDIVISTSDESSEKVASYIDLVMTNSSQLTKNILDAIPEIQIENYRLLQALEVKKVDASFYSLRKTSLTFELPLKTELKSNLNKFNAAPRQKIPRSWWEIELIIPTHIQKMNGFPSRKNNTNHFEIFTDDGFNFRCHVSGGGGPQFNKNFESSGNLSVLGYWLKGRLVASGVVQEGDLITEKVLEDYGRKSLTMTQLSDNLGWFLDMSVQPK